jgi:hypothetical protein
MYYIPRKLNNYDSIYGADDQSSYQHAYPIEIYIKSIDGFGGDGSFLSKFGLEIKDTGNFIVSRKRWTEVAGSTGNTILSRPAEGDLIYFPRSKSFFEIRKVEGHEPFYQIGKLFVYKMMCELYQYSNEVFNTGVEEIDSLTIGASLIIGDHELLQENGESLLLETNALTPIVLEDYNLSDDSHVQIGADNEKFEENIDNILDFSERNPFGEAYQ